MPAYEYTVSQTPLTDTAQPFTIQGVAIRCRLWHPRELDTIVFLTVYTPVKWLDQERGLLDAEARELVKMKINAAEDKKTEEKRERKF